ncbi:MAG: hypothetical protein H0T62_03065 [Parachlamydiaceae bacterium]|nr:hypothetical protein [Parachlamydiaceae bacterium]
MLLFKNKIILSFLIMLMTVPSLSLFADRKSRNYYQGQYIGGQQKNKYFRDNNYGHSRSWGGWNDRYWGMGRNYGVGTHSYYRPYYNDYHPHTYGYDSYSGPLYDYDTTYFFVIPE